MKKKTVITTEKHEVWVIRQPSGKTTERDLDSVNDDAEPANSLITLLDHSETDVPPDPHQD